MGGRVSVLLFALHFINRFKFRTVAVNKSWIFNLILPPNSARLSK